MRMEFQMTDFYKLTISRLNIGIDDTVLVVCGGEYDRNVLFEHGLRNVVISNLAPHDSQIDYAPYSWERIDAESINLPDRSRDWVIVNAGLHHCGSPHKAMCEMLRVAKKGIVVLEARDSALMRVAVLLGLSVDFELEPAILTNGRSGGYRDGPIPNYIYRWTEREVEKTATSFEPAEVLDFTFFYGLTLPLQRISMSTNHVKVFVVHLIRLTSFLFKAFLPKQGNNFAFVV